MEWLRKLRSFSFVSPSSVNPADIAVTLVNPVRINIAPRVLEQSAGGENGSNQVEVFTVENELLNHRQIERLPVADDVFGDISTFLYRNQEENNQISSPIELTNEGNELAILPMPELNSVATGFQEEREDEAIQLKENLRGQESSLVMMRKVLLGRITNVKHTPSAYIHTHFDMMFLLGTCTYRTITRYSTEKQGNWMHCAIVGLQKVLFVIIVILSFFESFCDAKYFFIWFLAGGELNQFVRFAFNLTNLVSCIYGAYILCHKRNDICKMVEAINTYECNWQGTFAKPVLSIILVAFTINFSLIKTLLVIDYNDVSLKKIILQNSYQLSEDVFLWSAGDLNATTFRLDTEFGTNLTFITILMGNIKICRTYSFTLLQGMMWDIIGNVVLTMLCWMMFFMAFVNLVADNVPEENIEESKRLQAKRVVVSKMYRQIRHALAAVNEVFEPLLMLFHVTNVLRYAFFMERVIYPDDVTAFEYIHLLYDILKSEIIYMTAIKIAKQNKMIRKWIRNWSLWTGKIDLGNKQMDFSVVLDELDEEPLGLGQGDLFIHQGFHFGLLGLVSSLFVMMANKTGAEH